MSISTQPFKTFVSNAVAAVQGAVSALVNLNVGSVLLATVEAICGVALWLQGMGLRIAAMSRFATSNGPDADSWGADFGFNRLPAQPATGQVTFTSLTPAGTSTVQAAASAGLDANGNTIWTSGVIVQTADGTQQYIVIPDTTQAAYNAGLNAYVLAPGVSNINATVQATVAGTDSNASAGAINTLGSGIPGVDEVSNALAFTNGEDAELDAAYKGRFPGFLLSLSGGTVAAIIDVIVSVQQGVTTSITENANILGVPTPGYFYAVVNDGSGNPPSSLIQNITNAVDNERPIGSTFGVFGPTVVPATITMTLTVAAGYTKAAVSNLIQTALAIYGGSFSVGQSMPYTKIAQVVYDASPGVSNVTNLRLNGSTADLAATNLQTIEIFSVSIS